MPGFLGGLSKVFGADVKASRNALKKVGLEGQSALRRSKVMAPMRNGGAANLHTGRGTGRTFISNAQYEKLHQIRGAKIAGGAMVAGSASLLGSDKKSYYNPIRTPKGSGRFA